MPVEFYDLHPVLVFFIAFASTTVFLTLPAIAWAEVSHRSKRIKKPDVVLLDCRHAGGEDENDFGEQEKASSSQAHASGDSGFANLAVQPGQAKWVEDESQAASSSQGRPARDVEEGVGERIAVSADAPANVGASNPESAPVLVCEKPSEDDTKDLEKGSSPNGSPPRVFQKKASPVLHAAGLIHKMQDEVFESSVAEISKSLESRPEPVRPEPVAASSSVERTMVNDFSEVDEQGRPRVTTEAMDRMISEVAPGQPCRVVAPDAEGQPLMTHIRTDFFDTTLDEVSTLDPSSPRAALGPTSPQPLLNTRVTTDAFDSALAEVLPPSPSSAFPGEVCRVTTDNFNRALDEVAPGAPRRQE